MVCVSVPRPHAAARERERAISVLAIPANDAFALRFSTKPLLRGGRALSSIALARAFARTLGPLVEVVDGASVDVGLVPPEDRLKVARAGNVCPAALPATATEIIRRGGEYVGHAAQQVAASVAVIVDRILDVG